MKLPDVILTLLLRGGHLSVEERKAMGLWPNETLAYDDVLDHLAKLIRREEWFPEPLPEVKPGEAVYEGVCIQRIAAFHYVCHCRRHSACDPCTVAEETRRRFFTARGAAKFYLKWELHLPGRLDGWPVL